MSWSVDGPFTVRSRSVRGPFTGLLGFLKYFRGHIPFAIYTLLVIPFAIWDWAEKCGEVNPAKTSSGGPFSGSRCYQSSCLKTVLRWVIVQPRV
jgi:hypothetical protein